MLSNLSHKQQQQVFKIAIRQMDRHVCHPAVAAALELSERDGDCSEFDTIFSEMAHTSKDGRLAYTRNIDEGNRDICTVVDAREYVTTRFDDLTVKQIDSIFANLKTSVATEEIEIDASLIDLLFANRKTSEATEEIEVESPLNSFLTEFLSATINPTGNEAKAAQPKVNDDAFELPEELIELLRKNLPAGSKVVAIHLRK